MQNKYTKPSGSYISFMSNKVKTYGGVNLAQGIPGFEPPEDLTTILSEITKEKLHQYAPGNGNTKLIDLLVEKYKIEYHFKTEDFLVLQGATEALSLLYTYFCKIIERPFSALAFDPVYESYKYLPNIFNTNFIPFSFDKGGGIDFAKLENQCIIENVKVIFLGSPGNPYGRMWSKEEINQLLQISNKLSIYIILDAVYRELYFEEKPYIPLEQFNPNLFYTNSFSKTLSVTGWRVGYLIAHKKHMQKIKSIHDYTGLCASSILQQAIVNYLEKTNFGETYKNQLRKKLKQSYNLLSASLKQLGFDIPETKGGYFIWAKLPDGFFDGFKFAIDLYDNQKVAVIPGEHFSANAENYVRFNIAREKNEIEESIKRLKMFFN